MSVWFEGDGEIACSLDSVVQAIDDIGAYFAGVVSLMPGLTSVTLADQHPDIVIITTSEGLMKRTNVSTRVEEDQVTIEYQAGSKVTVNSHSIHQFIPTEHGVAHRLTVRDITAPGLLGFFYRKFGRSKIGKALMTAEKTYLESSAN